MKRSALILLTSMYLISCLGMGIDRFYCCGKLASVKLVYGASDTETGKAKKVNCCRNEVRNFKINDTHFGGISFSLTDPLPVVLQHVSFSLSTLYPTANNSVVHYSNAPPGHPDIPVYTLNCAYRI